MRLRNLILSLFLVAGAAAFTACEGERGPVGEAGPAGTAGAAGAKGETGDAGKSSEEIPSAYEFLKNWGKDDGMAACSDDIFDKTKMVAFPGPAALGKAAAANQKVPTVSGNTTTVSPTVTIGDPAMANASANPTKGKCSNKVFIDTAGAANSRTGKPFTFTPTQVGKKMTEDPKRGKTAVLENTTLTTTEREFWGGTVTVNLRADTPEAEGMDRLAVRCNVGERPVGTSSKTIKGEYRIVLTTETENILRKDAGGSTVIKDTAGAGNDYELKRYTTQICIKLDSVPGTVKCFVKMAVNSRNDTDEMVKKSGNNIIFRTTDQMALYSDGKLTQVMMPIPYSSGALAGRGGTTNFPFNLTGTTSRGPAQADLNSASKLCNFFAEGVIPCPSGEVAGAGGDCRQG